MLAAVFQFGSNCGSSAPTYSDTWRTTMTIPDYLRARLEGGGEASNLLLRRRRRGGEGGHL